MDLLFFRKTLSSESRGRWLEKRGNLPQTHLPGQGERGDIILPFILTLMAGTFLFFGLFLLNTLYENRTKEHLHDFKNRWEYLEKRYQD